MESNISNTNSRLFIDAVPEKTFYLSNGKPIRNLSELISELDSISQDEFSYHCNTDKDDFAVWIDDALKMGDLAAILRDIKSKEEYIDAIRGFASPKAVSARIHEESTKMQPVVKATANASKAPKLVAASKNISKTVPTVPDTYIKDINRLRTDLDNVNRFNSELGRKMNSVEKMNSELIKKLDTMARINSELVKRMEDLGKTNSELGKRMDLVDKTSSDVSKKTEDMGKKADELSKRTDLLGKNIAEAPLPDIVLKSVSQYFDGKEFKNRVMEMFKPIIVDIHAKDRNALKAEASEIANMNAQLEKKLAISLVNRTKETEKIAHSSVSQALNAQMSNVGAKVEKAMESKISKMANAFDRRAESIAAANLVKFKNDVTKEKHDLRAIASDVMHKEFEKVFNDDEHLAKIVARYQKIFNEGADHIAKMHKDSEDRFNDELIAIKDKIALESQDVLNKQLTDTIKKQREVLDSELAKALTSNKYFISRFEKEVINREKLLLESADRKLKENYTKHDGMLSSEFKRYQHELGDLKIQFDKDFKAREAQFNESINSKIHLALNKEFNDILINQRNELSKTIGDARISAIGKIEAEFSGMMSKHKEFMLEQFNKASAEQNVLKDRFLVELKSEEDKLLSKLKDMMQKDMSATLKEHRELLDKELEKTVLANKYFVERFEKEIMGMDKKLTESGAKIYEENYTKHKAMMQDAFVKQSASLKNVVMEFDVDATNREAKMFANLNAVIPASVREAVNKEFSRLITDEKNALDVELKKAEEMNKEIEKKFENALKERADNLVERFSKDMNAQIGQLIVSQQAKLGELITTQQAKLDQELVKARESFELMEGKKNEIIDKAKEFFEDMNEYSANKLKELEREHDKHIKKVSQITTLITKAETAMDDLKELKAQVNSDKKTISKENKEYGKLMTELDNLKNNLSQEKKWIALYREKVNIYNMIRQCSEHIRLRDAHNARILYNKIAEAYAKADFDDNDRAELYNAATLLLKETKRTFPEAKTTN